MKKIILALVFILPFIAFSQSHYIIPDIGAPDMAVYVEMIAPHDQKGYFGDDGFYLPGVDTKVQINATKNSQYVTFGPMVVSWDGRLISTHIFIDRSATPTSVTADPAYEVVIEITGSTVPATRIFNYFIVKPQSLGVNGDISSINERIFGEGSLGVRSQMGAMIIDSLTLGDYNNSNAQNFYRFSKNDPDNDISNGNQGFMPVVFLSKGPVTNKGSISNYSDIRLYALGKNGGPGGGGGGGNFTDIPAGTGGTSGGDGFTGGGAGGTNRYASSSGVFRSLGVGTGSNGSSINGITGNIPSGGWEASYGGTGHPFGTNGKQTLDGKTADDQGGYGGGSGYRNNKRGGGGGNANAGIGEVVTGGTTAGKAVGNEMIVPLSGGSGGAGGNPEAGFFSPIVSSGEGGGGGGGISFYAPIMKNIMLTANGDYGANGNDNSDGGDGSGGSIILMSKLDIFRLAIGASSTRALNEFGKGRLRIDGELKSTLENTYVDDYYIGITTDTSNFIKPRHRLFGTHKPNNKVKIYQKTKTTDWTLIGDFSSPSIGWVNPLNFNVNHEDEYYIVAIQEETQIVDDYTYQPSFVLSQAATNMLRFGEPEIYCPKDTSFDVINCANVVYEDSIQIQSIGGDFLNIIVEDKWVFGDKGFEILNLGDYDISPQDPDSLFYIKFKYTKIAGQSGIITDTLILYNNSPTKDSCRIAVSINLLDATVSFYNEANTKEIDTLDLGSICIGEIATGKFNIRNDSNFNLTELRLEKSGKGQETDFTLNPNVLSDIDAGASKLIDVSFQDLDNNPFVNGVSIKVLIYSEQCPDPIDSLIVFVKVVTSELTLSEADKSLDFGSVPKGQTKDMTVTLTNTGDKPALIQLPTVPAPFTLISPTVGSFPIKLQPIKTDPTAKIDFTFRYSPITEGNSFDSTFFKSIADIPTNSCDFEINMNLTGTSTVAEISFSDTLDFGVIYECLTDTTDDVYIRNLSNFVVTIDTANAKLIGGDISFFKLLAKPRTISVGGQNQFRVKYEPPVIPTTSGFKQSKIQFELDPTTGEVFEIVVRAEVDTFLVDYSPGKPFDMGDIPTGLNVPPKKLRISNFGKLPRTVTGITLPVGSKLTVTHPSVVPVTIAPGGWEEFDVDISLLLDEVGPFSEDITFDFAKCDNKLPVTVIANGIKGELELMTDLNLGDQPPCFDITTFVKFRNIGTADILLDSVIVEENGIELDRFMNLPQTLIVKNNGNPFGEDIRLSKSGLKDGTKFEANLTAYTTENGTFKKYPYTITADIKSGLVVTPQPVDFGIVNLGQSNTISVTVAKDPGAQFSDTASFRVDVDRLNMVFGYSDYQFNSPDSLFLLGGDLQPKTFDIVFTPTNNQNFDDTLNLKVSINGCDFLIPVALRGVTTVGDTLLIYTKDMLELEPNIDRYRIPIYGKLISSNAGVEKSANITISNLDIDFNKTIFFPMTITNGTFTRRETDAASTLLSINMENAVAVNTSDEVILTELVGPTMLGDKKDNLFHLSATPSLLDSTGISTIIATSSFFNLKVCSEGGDRLLEYTQGFNYTLINSLQSIVIEAHLVEPGVHRVRLMDMTGKTELVKEIVRTNNDGNDYSIEYDTSHLSSGVYYILFETPARYKTHKLIIIK
ncbi:MAG: choice-of-anchor D domain-containing protein [Candidatus Kapaibacterium sp.]